MKGRFSQVTAILVNMPLNKDCIMIKMLYRLKRYTAQKSLNEFSIKSWNNRSFQSYSWLASKETCVFSAVNVLSERKKDRELRNLGLNNLINENPTKQNKKFICREMWLSVSAVC